MINARENVNVELGKTLNKSHIKSLNESLDKSDWVFDSVSRLFILFSCAETDS